MTLHEYVSTLTRSWRTILVVTLLGGAVAFGYSHTLTPQYRSSTSVIVLPQRGDNASDLVQGSTYVQNLVQSYGVLASSPVVLDQVVKDLHLDIASTRLSQQVTVDTPLNTVVIQISVVDSSPEQARDIANTIGTELAKSVEQLSPQGADKTPAVRMTTISPAALPVSPISPNSRLNLLVGLVAGFALGACYAIGRRLLGRRIIDPETVLDDVGVPVIGEVLQAERALDLSTSIAMNPTGPSAESLRVLAANYGLVDVDGPFKVVLVTSGSPKEGKSSIALGLGMTLSEYEERVLVVDGDLRMPRIAAMTQLEGSVGVTNVLVGDVTLSEAAQPWGPHGLEVLASGTAPPNPGLLLASARFRKLIEEARTRYDIVVIDSAPVLLLSDALWLAPLVDGIIVVARVGETKSNDLRTTVARLQNARTPVVGVVLNGTDRRQHEAYSDYGSVDPVRPAQPSRMKSSVAGS